MNFEVALRCRTLDEESSRRLKLSTWTNKGATGQTQLIIAVAEKKSLVSWARKAPVCSVLSSINQSNLRKEGVATDVMLECI